MNCNRCGHETPEGERYTYQGQTLCEDCYLDMRLGVKACDPWAVHSASRFRETRGLKGSEGLTELQKGIFDFVKSKGKVTRDEVRKYLSLPEQEMQSQLAILRHCELIKGHKEGGKIYLVPFSDEGTPD
jgi:hypothetical protein